MKNEDERQTEKVAEKEKEKEKEWNWMGERRIKFNVFEIEID